jgi:biotin carboxyl carrier protein
MQYEIEVGGRRRHVVVSRTGHGFAVAVDGHTRQVDVARIDGHTLSLILDNVWPADASITADPVRGELTVHVAGTTVALVVNGRRHYGRKGDLGGGETGPQRLVAPMPGKVARVPVAVGDIVRARQPVVVVEAMKMENELRASRDGTVAEVLVREGMSVEAGALLIVIQ